MYDINVVLPKKSYKIGLDRIERTHRVGLRKNNGKSKDLIVRFICYRDCANVFHHKRNLKNYNQNPSTSSKVFIKEALTKLRLTILFKASKLVRNKLVNSVCTYDGRIIVKLG